MPRQLKGVSKAISNAKGIVDSIKKAGKLVQTGKVNFDNFVEFQGACVSQLDALLSISKKNHDDAIKNAEQLERDGEFTDASKYRNIAKSEVANIKAILSAKSSVATDVAKVLGDAAKNDAIFVKIGFRK